MRRPIASQPGDLAPCGQNERQGIRPSGYLDEGVGAAAGRQAFEDAAEGGGGGLVAGQQQVGRLAGVPVEADGTTRAALVGADDDDVTADGNGLQPARSRAECAVSGVGDEIHVEFPPFGAHGANRVGAKRVAIGVGQCTPAVIPAARGNGFLVVGADIGESPAGQRKHDLDALVQPGRAEGVELFTEEGHPGEMFTQ